MNPVLHDFVGCDLCKQTPIVGIRYKCSVCPNFDLCTICVEQKESNNTTTALHDDTHLFYRVATNNAGQPSEPAALRSRSRWTHNEMYCGPCDKLIIGYRYYCEFCDMSFCEVSGY